VAPVTTPAVAAKALDIAYDAAGAARYRVAFFTPWPPL
jgi:hypothetical protein